MKNLSTRKIGKKAESIAALFLKQKNFKIIERNYYSEFGEVDIIAKDKNNLWHFVEVKSKKVNSKYGRPEEAVDEIKRERIKKTVEVYLEKHNLEEVNLSLDVVTVLFDGSYKVMRTKLLEGIFE